MHSYRYHTGVNFELMIHEVLPRAIHNFMRKVSVSAAAAAVGITLSGVRRDYIDIRYYKKDIIEGKLVIGDQVHGRAARAANRRRLAAQSSGGGASAADGAASGEDEFDFN